MKLHNKIKTALTSRQEKCQNTNFLKSNMILKSKYHSKNSILQHKEDLQRKEVTVLMRRIKLNNSKLYQCLTFQISSQKHASRNKLLKLQSQNHSSYNLILEAERRKLNLNNNLSLSVSRHLNKQDLRQESIKKLTLIICQRQAVQCI